MERVEKLSLYITFIENNLFFALFNKKDLTFYSTKSITKTKIVPELVENLQLELKKLNLTFSNLHAIYWDEKEVGWNSNRLISIFLKTLGFTFSELFIYIKKNKEESWLSPEFLQGNKERFLTYLDKFKLESWREIVPLCKECPITNI